MKKTYMKPATQIVKVEIEQNLLAGSVTGQNVSDTEVTGVKGFSRQGRSWDEDDYDE